MKNKVGVVDARNALTDIWTPQSVENGLLHTEYRVQSPPSYRGKDTMQMK